MDKKKNYFQIGLMVLFGAAALIAIVLFATNKGAGSDNTGLSGEIIMWGTLPSASVQSGFAPIFDTFSDLSISYREFRDDEFDAAFVSALAAGQGPDLILLEGQGLLERRDFLTPLSYENFPLTLFQSTYVDSAQIFLLDDGVYAFPLLIDPLVMFYNKDLLASSFLIEPPATWDDIITTIPNFVEQTDSGSILRAGIALGTAANITHAPEILATLIMQLGNPLVQRNVVENDFDTEFEAIVKDQGQQGQAQPAVNSLIFYTSFADRSQSHYSWSQSLAQDKDAFLAGDLALYLGHASEFAELVVRNPNLNIGVGMIPQVADTSRKLTFARVYGVAVTRTSKNIPGAFAIANTLGGADSASLLSSSFNVPPIRRDLLAQPPEDIVNDVFYKSAIIARTWFNPASEIVDEYMRQIIRDMNARREQPQRLISAFEDYLNDFFAR